MPGSPVGVVNRTQLPRGPSVIARIETRQATSSRSARLSHSRRLQLRTSIALGEPRDRAARGRACSASPGRRSGRPLRAVARAARPARFGSDATTRRSHEASTREASAAGSSAAWQPRKPIGQLVAEAAAGHQQGPVRRMVGATRIGLVVDPVAGQEPRDGDGSSGRPSGPRALISSPPSAAA